MKLSILASAALLICGMAFYAPTVGQTNRGPDSPVLDVSIQGKNIALLLSKFAYERNIPIGFEVASNDDLLADGSVNVQIARGTVRDVLDAIVAQKPIYTWRVEDNVINVFPKEANRDHLLKAVLETTIKDYSIARNTNHFTFRESIIKLPEVQRILEINQIKSGNELLSPLDRASLGRDFSLRMSNATLKSLLNRVIRDSKARYWIVNRFGDDREYLLLNL